MPQGSKTQQGLLSSGQRAIAVYVAAAPSMNCLFMSQTSDLKPGLYIVATPIGNLGELSPRAADILARASAIAVEDRRVTATLRRNIGTKRPMIPSHDDNADQMRPEMLTGLASDEIAGGRRVG